MSQMFPLPTSTVHALTPTIKFAPDAAVWVLPVLFVITFLLGSIPWGVIISKCVYKKDIRKEGSGNIGTTNAMRSLGAKGGIIVFLLDFSKGLLAGWLGLLVSNNVIALADWLAGAPLGVAFIGCVWGHIFSPWLAFKGGKGIAVAVGAIVFVFGPVGLLIEIAVFIILVIITKYVSAGSIAAAVICPFIALWLHFGQWALIIMCAIAAITVIWAHRANIKRLLSGTENRIGKKEVA